MAVFGRRKRVDERVVDLRDRPRFEFGYPTPCPQCGSNGYLDSIDLNERRMYQHCPACWNKWVTAEDEVSTTA